VTAFDPSNPGTVSVSLSEENDGAQMWLASQNPLCDTTNLTFDLTTAPANVEVDNGGTIAPGDDIEIASAAGSVNCVPVAIDVQAQTQDSQT
ncbi:MAG: hypothetical protein KGJ77_06400, partial [Acidobacteriota bacterium]|nr:hypothetical protein [Acidobacteriota bacterium]